MSKFNPVEKMMAQKSFDAIKDKVVDALKYKHEDGELDNGDKLLLVVIEAVFMTGYHSGWNAGIEIGTHPIALQMGESSDKRFEDFLNNVMADFIPTTDTKTGDEDGDS